MSESKKDIYSKRRKLPIDSGHCAINPKDQLFRGRRRWGSGGGLAPLGRGFIMAMVTSTTNSTNSTQRVRAGQAAGTGLWVASLKFMKHFSNEKPHYC